MSGKRFWHTAVTILALLVLLLVGFGESVYAHRPYSREIQNLKGPKAESLTLERFYGDGVFFGDPVRVQLVNEHKVIVAYAETDSHTAVFCPSLQFCWAFPYHRFLVNPWRLDYQHLDYQAKSQDQHSEDLYYPNYGTEHVMGFVQGPPWIKVLSPLIIACDEWLVFLFVIGLAFFPTFTAAFYMKKVSQQERTIKIIGTFAGFALVVLYAIFCLFVGFVLLFTWSEPLVYILLFGGVGLVLGDSLAKWLIRKDLTKTPIPYIQEN